MPVDDFFQNQVVIHEHSPQNVMLLNQRQNFGCPGNLSLQKLQCSVLGLLIPTYEVPKLG